MTGDLFGAEWVPDEEHVVDESVMAEHSSGSVAVIVRTSAGRRIALVLDDRRAAGIIGALEGARLHRKNGRARR